MKTNKAYKPKGKGNWDPGYGGARQNTGKKSVIPNPARITLTVPAEHKDDLKKIFNDLIDKYRVVKK